MTEIIQNQIVNGQLEKSKEQISGQSQSEQFSNGLMQVINNIATNKDIDISKLSAMLDMQERVLNRNAGQAFTSDLAAMQSELPLVGKLGEGHNKAKYARLEDINEAIRPTLQKYGFAVTFRTKQSDKSLTVTAILSHRMGHSEETDLILPLDTSGSKNAVQAVGSTISYGKRYALCALLNISTGDDVDGHLPPQSTSFITGAQVAKLKSACEAQGVSIEALEKRAGAQINSIQSNRFGAAMAWILKQGVQNNA